MDNPIGKVTHYFDKISVAIIDLEKGTLKTGQQVKFKHGEEEFTHTIDSMQIEHQPVEEVKSGDAFGVKVSQPVKEGWLVYSA